MQAKTAIQIMLVLVGAIILFHLTIVLKIVPYDITWGGRLKNDQEMYAFEAFSLALNVVLVLVLLIKGAYIRPILPIKAANFILWFFFGLFALNTIGNFLATTVLEKGFSVLTILFCILIWIILKRKGAKNQ